MRLTDGDKLKLLNRIEDWASGPGGPAAASRWDRVVEHVQDLVDRAVIATVVRGAARERRYAEVRDAVILTCSPSYGEAGIHAVRSLLRTFGVHKAVDLKPAVYDEFLARLAQIREALSPV